MVHLKSHSLRMLVTALTIGLTAQAGDRSDWQNLGRLSTGERIEVTRKNREKVKATFVSVAADAIQLRDGQQDIAVPRIEVARVRRSKGGHMATWIGLGVGAGAGAGIGAGTGEWLAEESGGDFRGLKPAITGAMAGVGALVGLGIGHWIDSRNRTIYDIK